MNKINLDIDKGITRFFFVIMLLSIIPLLIVFNRGSSLFENLKEQKANTATNPHSSPVDTSSLIIFSPSPTEEPVANNYQEPVQQTAVVHDGSRTGEIVPYHDYCTNQNISVYENEKVPYVIDATHTMYITRGNFECFARYLAGPQGNNNSRGSRQGSSQVSISCPTALGAFTEWGNNYEEANNRCKQTQISHQDIKNSQDALYNTITHGLDDINSRTFQLNPTPTIEPVPTPLPLPPITKEPCVLVPPGFGGPTSGRTDENGNPCAN